MGNLSKLILGTLGGALVSLPSFGYAAQSDCPAGVTETFSVNNPVGSGEFNKEVICGLYTQGNSAINLVNGSKTYYTTVYQGGTLYVGSDSVGVVGTYVSDAASASYYTILRNGANQVVYYKSTAYRTAIYNGVNLYVYSGGIADSITFYNDVSNSANLYLSDSAYLEGTSTVITASIITISGNSTRLKLGTTNKIEIYENLNPTIYGSGSVVLNSGQISLSDYIQTVTFKPAVSGDGYIELSASQTINFNSLTGNHKLFINSNMGQATRPTNIITYKTTGKAKFTGTYLEGSSVYIISNTVDSKGNGFVSLEDVSANPEGKILRNSIVNNANISKSIYIAGSAYINSGSTINSGGNINLVYSDITAMPRIEGTSINMNGGVITLGNKVEKAFISSLSYNGGTIYMSIYQQLRVDSLYTGTYALVFNTNSGLPLVQSTLIEYLKTGSNALTFTTVNGASFSNNIAPLTLNGQTYYVKHIVGSSTTAGYIVLYKSGETAPTTGTTIPNPTPISYDDATLDNSLVTTTNPNGTTTTTTPNVTTTITQPVKSVIVEGLNSALSTAFNSGAIAEIIGNSMHSRVGELMFGIKKPAANKLAGYTRVYNSTVTAKDTESTIKLNVIEIGADYRLGSSNYIGALIQAGTGDSTMKKADLDNTIDKNEIKTTALGLYYMGLFNGNYFVDSALRFGSISQDVTLTDEDKFKVDQTAMNLSLEAGKKIVSKSGYFITPRAELNISNVGAKTFKTDSGQEIKLDAFNSMKIQAGAIAGKSFVAGNGILQPYAKLSVVNEASGKSKVTLGSESYESEAGTGTRTNFGAGVDYLAGSRTTFNLDFSTESGKDYSNSTILFIARLKF